MSMDLSLRRLRAAAGVVLCAVASAQGLVADLDTSPAPAPSSNPSAFLAAQGRVFFRAERPGLGAELFVTDGTAAGTRLVLDVHPTGSSQPVLLGSAGGRVWFSADDGVHGRELWVSDGTAAGTHLVVDVAPGRRDGLFERTYLALVALPNGRVVFAADDGIHGPELWGTDGTQAGTEQLTDGPSAPGVVSWGREAFFAAPDGSPAVFRTDGTVAGTSRFLDTGPLGGTPRFLSVDPGRGDLLFATESNLVLWAVDAAGNATRLLALPPVPHVQPWFLVTAGAVFLHGWDRVRAFRRDTSTFEELPPDQPLRLVPFGRGAVILGRHPTAGWEPWYSDGTAGGTVLLGDLEPNGDSPLWWVAELGSGTGVLATRRGLWAIDGTATGTRRIADAPIPDPIPT